MKIFFSFVLTTLLGAYAYAGTPDLTSLGLYEAVKESCTRVTSKSLTSLEYDQLHAGYFPGTKLTQIHSYIRHQSLVEALKDFNLAHKIEMTDYIINDDLFLKALAECYPNEPNLRQFFVKSILDSDRAGKAVGVVLVVTLFKGTGRLFAMTETWSSLVYRALQISNKAFMALVASSYLRSDTSSKSQDENIVESVREMAKPEYQERLKSRYADSMRSLLFINQAKINRLTEKMKTEKDSSAIERLIKDRNQAELDIKEIEIWLSMH